MKLKKMGTILLAVCMIFAMLPTIALAASGPDAEKKVIENDLIVQLPNSFDDMIGTSPSDWLAVTSEPTWDDGTILDYVETTQKFYDSTGKEMTETDTFQNNSRYMMEMTFQSWDSYDEDYYYVLSGENNVYVNHNGNSFPMNVTVDEDVDGNPVITATFNFTIGIAPEDTTEDTTYEWVLSRWDDFENKPLDEVTIVIGQPVKYRVQLMETRPDGTKEPVSTGQIKLEFDNIFVDNDIDYAVETYDTSYMLTITANRFERPDDLNLGTENVGYKPGVFAAYNLKVVKPTEIELDKVYNISGQNGQELCYQYQPSKSGEQYYTLWIEGASVFKTDDSTSDNGETGELFFYKSTDQKPITFWVRPYYLSDPNSTRFELVETKLVKEIEILQMPDTILEDIEKKGDDADLRGMQFKVTYADGSTYTHELSGIRFTTSEGGNPFVVYRMDCRSDGHVYECYPHIDRNSIQISCWDPDSGYVSGTIDLSRRSKVNITEGLSGVTGNLGDTEYNTVEKIENKLTETIVSNEGYTADNTVLYDIEFVTSEDGGETLIPVTAENFPKEGIDVTLPYPEGTNAADYDFTVVHMFDEDVNGHKAGEVETPEVTDNENGISFRLMGTSPVMVGYKKAAVTHTHSYGEWADCKDGINHQRSCSCGNVQKEAHAWDEGKVTKEATKDAEGIKTYTCKTCGATKTESIPKLTSNTTPSKPSDSTNLNTDTTPSNPSDSTNPNTDTTSPKTGNSTNITLWIALMIMTMAGLSCTYFVRRKTKSNH